MDAIDSPTSCTIVLKINYLIFYIMLVNYFIKFRLRIMMDINVCAKT